MGRSLRTSVGSTVTVFGWHLGATRPIAPGPGQVYETVDVEYCAGPQVQENANDLTPLFSLLLVTGSRVAPDSLSRPGEFRSAGTIAAGACVRGPIVFQVEGGVRARFVVFDSSPPTRWVVPG